MKEPRDEEYRLPDHRPEPRRFRQLISQALHRMAVADQRLAEKSVVVSVFMLGIHQTKMSHQLIRIMSHAGERALKRDGVYDNSSAGGIFGTNHSSKIN